MDCKESREFGFGFVLRDRVECKEGNRKRETGELAVCCKEMIALSSEEAERKSRV